MLTGVPPQEAEIALRTLSRARHVVIPHAGHGWGGEAADYVGRILEDFLNAADASKLDTSCLSQVRRPPFATGGPEG